ncbi:Fasciclin-like arabinogalactan protein 11 [Vitis vinifera]|uniref:Fasciclin-like arabinogalactan protein 11 n=1 Tax=Vitis vinifera TaxID=29760 RepID=A0A438GUB6_VITVI|nr:Fasciclin-like arabinogalactan protein 11 [Vitis vinifera]
MKIVIESHQERKRERSAKGGNRMWEEEAEGGSVCLSPNFVLTSHLIPLIKSPTLLHTHQKQLFLLYFLGATSFVAQYQKRLEKHDEAHLQLPPTTSGQSSPPALAPSSVPLVPSGPSGSVEITAVLKKARKFSTFIGLLKSTQMDAEINTRLKKSNQGITVFAPTDNAFSDLQTGTLNTFTDQQKTELARFHIIPSFISMSQFETVSNPLHTAVDGDTVGFPLNVVGNGTQVNMTTGVVNTTVDSTVYSDGQLAVYEIPQVLLSQGILRPQAPAPAPLPPKPKKATPLSTQAPSTPTTVSVHSSGATGLPRYAPTVVSIGVAVLAALPLCL